MKKILALVLAAMMTLAMCVGCGKKNDEAGATEICETKVGALAVNTLRQLASEGKKATENIFGLDIGTDESTGEIIISADDVDLDLGGFELESFKADAKSTVSQKDKAMTVVMDGEINEVPIDVFRLVWNDENISFSVPEILDAAFLFPVNNFKGKWNAGTLGSLAPIDEYVPEDLSFSTIFGTELFSEKFANGLGKAAVDFLNSCEGERTLDKIEMDGKDVACTKIEMRATEENVAALLETAIDALGDEMTAGGFIEMVLKQEIEGYDIDEYRNDIINELKQLIDDVAMEDVVFYAYAYDNKLVKLEYEQEINNENVKAEIAFTNPDSMIDGIEMVLSCKGEEENDEDFTVRLVTEGNLCSDDKVLKTKVKMTGDADGEKIELELTMNADEKNDKLEIAFAGNVDNDVVEVAVSCGYEKDKGSCRLKLDDVTYSIENEKGSLREILDETLGFDIDVELVYHDSAKTVTSGAMTEYDITQITESDLENLASAATAGLESLMNKIGLSYASLY